jgi:predicted enzyme related to lactoylglutathione lyase
MASGMKTVIYPVTDLEKAKAIFSAILGKPMMDQPYYVGWSIDGQDIGLDPNGHAKGMTGPVPYVHVDDIKSSLAAIVEAGATLKQHVMDVGGGRLIAWVTDVDGNAIGVLQPY